MLLGADRDEQHFIALVHRRQHVIGIILTGIIAPFLVDGDVAGLDQRRAVGTQHVARRPVAPGQQVHGHRVKRAWAIWQATARFQISA